MYSLNLTKFKNLSIILTNKYLVFYNLNGFISLKTNMFNLFIKNNFLFCNLYYYPLKYNLTLFFINKKLLSLFNEKQSKLLLNYSNNYLNSLFNTLYYLNYNYIISINLKGIGYKFILETNNVLKIRIGYSHYITYSIDKNIYMVLKNPTTLFFYSNNKFIINKLISNIKLVKKTNLYKGTGIFYDNEFIVLKKKNNNKNKNVK